MTGREVVAGLAVRAALPTDTMLDLAQWATGYEMALRQYRAHPEILERLADRLIAESPGRHDSDLVQDILPLLDLR